MNVLSLFDGMSCGHQALDRAGIKVDNYFASEIDKYAIQVTMANYPDTIQLGSVTQVGAKCFYLSEVYSYVCKKYFNDDLQSIQSIISEQELLYRIDQEQSFAAYFGTQIKDEESEASEHSTISINDRVWFFKNPMDCNGGIYDIIRGGERRAKPNRLNFDSLLEHSFWWNGDRQQKSIIKTESIEGVNRESSNGRNENEIERGSYETISIEGSKGTSKQENISAICEQRKEGDSPKSNGELGSNINGDKKERNGEEETRNNFHTTKKGIPTSYENNSIKQDSRSFSSIYKEVQATVVECEWGIIIFKGAINICCGGSPCQSFSFAGKRKGMATKCETEILTLEHYLELKADGYEFEGQSYLFWEYMRLLYEVKPKYFLLENVEMGEKWEGVLTQAIGVHALHINSALVSAQNRKRIYFTNIGMESAGLFGYPVSIIKQPKDKKILLKDILESEVDEKYFLSEKMLNYFDNRKDNFNGGKINIRDENKKASAILKSSASIDISDNFIVHNTMPRSSITGKGGTGHLSRNDGKTYCLDTGNTNAVEVREVKQLSTNNKSNGGTQPYQQDRIYDVNGISPALSASKSDLMITSGTLRTHKDGEGFREVQSGKGATIPARAREDGSGQNIVAVNSRIRRLTPIECERLQTVKDNYTNYVSDSQRYKMLGNGWTIEVISHIFKYIL